MSPVEPRPLVMGTISAPSTEEAPATLCFFPKIPAPATRGAAKMLPAAPTAARNERRLHPNFILKIPFSHCVRLFVRNRRGQIHDFGAADNLNERIAGNPFHRHAGAGRSLAGREISFVDVVQGLVLRLVGIESGLARWRGSSVGQGQTSKDLKMNDVVHAAAGALDRLF